MASTLKSDRPEQTGHDRRGLDHLLEVVQHQQRALRSEQRLEPEGKRRIARLAHAQGLGDGGSDQGGVGDRGEGDERDAMGELVVQVLGHLQREARLAHAGGAGQREEADVGTTQQGDDRGDLALPSDERGQREREIVGAVGGRRAGHGAAPSGGGRLGRSAPMMPNARRDVNRLPASAPEMPTAAAGTPRPCCMGGSDRGRSRARTKRPGVVVVALPAARRTVGGSSRAPYSRQRSQRLSPEELAAIRSLALTKSLRSLAAEFGVSHETVRAVIQREGTP